MQEYFKVTQIFQRYRKGFQQYPFSMGSFMSLSSLPGGGEEMIGYGIVPDGDSVINDQGVPIAEVLQDTELSLNSHVDPSFIHDYTLMSGLKECI